MKKVLLFEISDEPVNYLSLDDGAFFMTHPEYGSLCIKIDDNHLFDTDTRDIIYDEEPDLEETYECLFYDVAQK